VQARLTHGHPNASEATIACLRGDWAPRRDPGWRSGGALGLAVAAMLRWGDDVPMAIEKAARIDGESDSVASLFLGAAGGIDAIPESWLDSLWAGRLKAIARSLAARGRPVVAVANLHGHPKLLEALLALLDAELEDYVLVTLGDYVDNGPAVPGSWICSSSSRPSAASASGPSWATTIWSACASWATRAGMGAGPGVVGAGRARAHPWPTAMSWARS